MPGYDRTGPEGAGPMTGGARGYCNPVNKGFNPGFIRGYDYGRGLGLRRGFRSGFGFGMRRNYGRCFRWYPVAFGPAYPVDAAEEMDMLKAEADYMQKSLETINKRIEDLEKKSSEQS